MTIATPTSHRQRYLRASLDELIGSVRRPDADRHRASIQVGSRTLPIEGWEWDILANWSGPSVGPEAAPRWRSLVVEGLALQSRCHADLERLAAAGASGAGADAARDDLQLDALLAFRVLAELQRETERLVVGGSMDEAKRLTQFRRRLSESLNAIEATLGEEALQQAKALAAEPATPIPERMRPSEGEAKLKHLLALEAQLERREEARSRPVASPALPPPTAAVETAVPVTRSTHVRARAILGALFAVLVATWLVLGALGGTRPAVRREVDAAALAGTPAVRAVMSRPPSLFVTVDATEWAGLAAADRDAALSKIATTADAAGYDGAVLRGTDGAVVGQWLRSQGARLVKRGS